MKKIILVIRKVWRAIRTPFLVIFIIVMLITIWRLPAVKEKKETAKIIAQIRATKLTLDDVLGKNLPPDPGADADKTPQGIDANKNGIRDDVELAIFKQYPTSAKMRAPLLQYALNLQLIATLPFVNEEIATAWAEENSRTSDCIADTFVPRKTPESSRTNAEVEKIDEYYNFLEIKQFNTMQRQKDKDNFYKKIGSHGDALGEKCDINPNLLPN
ncbi:MAG: hypothetical protein ABIJ94_00560 [candidate division WOR-3 bacterium]